MKLWIVHPVMTVWLYQDMKGKSFAQTLMSFAIELSAIWVAKTRECALMEPVYAMMDILEMIAQM